MAVLIVEDDPDLRDVVTFALQRAGYEVIAAGDGVEGLRLWRETKPELVVLDVRLPRLDGWSVCREGRQAFRTPVILLTAADEATDIAHGHALGADDYITKPFALRRLITSVEQLLRRPGGGATSPGRG